MKPDNPNTSVGMSENVEGLLCYLIGWVTGVFFLIIEKKSRFVKFHALQAIIAFLPLFVLRYLVVYIPAIGTILSWIIGVGVFLLWLLCMYKAYNNEYFKLPIAGKLAEQQLKK